MVPPALLKDMQVLRESLPGLKEKYPKFSFEWAAPGKDWWWFVETAGQHPASSAAKHGLKFSVVYDVLVYSLLGAWGIDIIWHRLNGCWLGVDQYQRSISSQERASRLKNCGFVCHVVPVPSAHLMPQSTRFVWHGLNLRPPHIGAARETVPCSLEGIVSEVVLLGTCLLQ